MPIKCPECEATFKYPSRLRVHVTTHRKEKYICGTCGVACGSLQNLQKHVLSEHYKRSYRCKSCTITFCSKEGLKAHFCETVHLCPDPECGKSFSKNSNLQVHIRTSHMHISAFECAECHGKFKHKCSLKRHLMMHKIYQCKTGA